MAIFTLSEIQEQKAAFKAALAAVSHAQEYSIGSRRFTKADLPEIRQTLEWLDAEESKLTSSVSTGSRPVATIGRISR